MTEITLETLSRHAVVTDDSVTFPGAEAPARTRRVDSDGVGIAVYEWGDAEAPPLLLMHGGFDFARTFDVFAPLLATGGWRVVSWDHRGHGDSDHAALNSFAADARDAVAVMDSTSSGRFPIVAHSKGGAVSLRLAEAWPHRFSHLVNIDGLPARRHMPDVSDTERTALLTTELAGWLDHRRTMSSFQRKPDTLLGLAKRRAQMNPRLTIEWLARLVTVGARRDTDGWRWKLDPMMRMGGFGPWRPEWSLEALPGLNMPFLGLLGTQPEHMAWGTIPSDLVKYLPRGGRLEVFEDAGHFIHIEQPGRVAAMVLDFLGAPA